MLPSAPFFTAEDSVGPDGDAEGSEAVGNGFTFTRSSTAFKLDSVGITEGGSPGTWTDIASTTVSLPLMVASRELDSGMISFGSESIARYVFRVWARRIKDFGVVVEV